MAEIRITWAPTETYPGQYFAIVGIASGGNKVRMIANPGEGGEREWWFITVDVGFLGRFDAQYTTRPVDAPTLRLQAELWQDGTLQAKSDIWSIPVRTPGYASLLVGVYEKGTDNPLKGATAVLDGRSATTDESGSARFDNLPSQTTYKLTVTLTGYKTASTTITLPEPKSYLTRVDLEKGVTPPPGEPRGNLETYSLPAEAGVAEDKPFSATVHNNGDAAGIIALGVENRAGNPGSVIVTSGGSEYNISPGNTLYLLEEKAVCARTTPTGKIRLLAQGTYTLRLIGAHKKDGIWANDTSKEAAVKVTETPPPPPPPPGMETWQIAAIAAVALLLIIAAVRRS